MTRVLRSLLLPGLLSVVALAVPGLKAGPAQAAAPTPVSATIGDNLTGQAMPQGFVGVSFETQAVRAYTGTNPKAINPVLVHLLRGLAPGGSPVIRIGGNSTDRTWWPVKGAKAPPGVRYTLTPGWMQTTRALARAVNAHLILGINLAADRPAYSASEARALLAGVGRRYIQDFEIGNEPDVYSQFPWYTGHGHLAYYARPHDYDLSVFTQDYTRFADGLPSFPLAGPAFAELNWLSGLGPFIAAEPKLKLVTIHRYPLRGCENDPIAAGYASEQTLLSDSSSAGMANSLAPYVAVTHAAGRPFRVGEMNSASCTGRQGVSNTFGSSLWVLDTLFNMASVGIDGVNLHSLPGAPYQPFSFSQVHKSWRAFVRPEYYGMLLFTAAFPPGAHMLPVSASPSPVKIWATRSTTGRTRVVLINKSSTPANVALQVPGAGGRASLEWLRAPSLTSTSGVTLGGQTFGTSTRTGVLASPHTTPTQAVSGIYSVALPGYSAVLLTQ
jgi:hypothetical protein